VLNVSTIGARRVEPGIGAYCASKAALEMVTRVLALELGDRGVRVNAVAPGMIPTETSSALLAEPGRAAELAAARPVKRLGTGQDVAETALFLLSDKASWITGEVVTVDGGALVTRA
jgi:NAD(P)-dependent dehydrogenase (short-subunit alcohol dehydrogenase family)